MVAIVYFAFVWLVITLMFLLVLPTIAPGIVVAGTAIGTLLGAWAAWSLTHVDDYPTRAVTPARRRQPARQEPTVIDVPWYMRRGSRTSAQVEPPPAQQQLEGPR